MALSMHTPAMAQIVVGGDGRPQTEIDQAVLDRLGSMPTLSDMFLGRQPVAPVSFTTPQAAISQSYAQPRKAIRLKPPMKRICSAATR